MQQRQLRLGDILDDYCPRERRLTNHVVVALVGAEVKQTRCSTCETEHEYKGARLPRLRRKSEVPALAPGGIPKRHEPAVARPAPPEESAEPAAPVAVAAAPTPESVDQPGALPSPDAPDVDEAARDDEGPVHRQLIRASLPRLEGTPPPARPATDFTIRQPAAGRHNRFRGRHGGGGGHQSQGNRSGGYMGGGGGNQARGGMPRHGGGQPQANRSQNRQGGQGRKRSR